MTSVHHLLPSASAAGGSPSAFLPSNPQFPPPNTGSRYQTRRHKFSHRVSCKGSSNDKNDVVSNSPLWLDRRNVLIGLGGLYGAVGLVAATQDTNAAPLDAPLFEECDPADLPAGVTSTDCCPPKGIVKDFIMPSKSAPIRVRPAAHLVTKEYIKKYEKAIELMKALPFDDPRNFYQQANVHCAYCNGAHQQLGLPELDFQVHNSWLFFPFHRWYLYFFERIAGKLLNDPTFAMPFWNWDSPAGFIMPPMYTDPKSSLYDPIRNPDHMNPINRRVVDLDFDGVEPTISDKEQESINLSIMYRQMVSNSKTKKLFFGSPYRAGEVDSPGGGSIESLPHGTVHVWCSDLKSPNLENMGNFYSAARDPIFYGHHSNVDRMWVLWKQMDKKRVDISDPDYLNTTFHFYDENAQLVRVRVGDCLDNKKLKFAYQNVDVPWMNSKPRPRKPQPVSKAKPKAKKHVQPGVANAAELPIMAEAALPWNLKNTLQTTIKRPKQSRSRKEDGEEELVIDFELDQSKYVKFDVYINDEDEVAVTRPDNTEFAGSFVNVARTNDIKMHTDASTSKHDHHHGSGPIVMRTCLTCLRLGLSDLLNDLNAEDDESVVVTLVPRSGCDTVTIGEIRIEYDED